MIDKIKIWFYGSVLGGWYLEFLLWWDNRKQKQNYLTPREIAEITREYSQLAEGVLTMKQSINNLLASKSKEEYQRALSEIEDLVTHAENKYDMPRAQFANMLREIYVKKGTMDVVTATDRAKMIETKIQGVYELQDHIVKRTLLRDIRKARQAGNEEQAQNLEQEFRNKYGRQH